MVVVTGIGLLCCLGDLSETWQRLQAGQSGIKHYQPFAELPPRPLGLIRESPIGLSCLTQTIVAAALEDAGLIPPVLDCAVAIGSSRSCQADWEALAAKLTPQSAIPWLATLPHQGAILAARQAGATGGVLAPMAACATGILALQRGVELIEQGQYQRVIAGAVEAPITRLTLAGFEQMGALAKTGSYPFDRQREGLVLGEGGAVFVLERADLALDRGAFIYGQILGFSLTCDAYHVSTPAPDCHSAAIALKHCLERSHLSPEQINYIHAHGTGTRLNDRREAQLIQSLFLPSVPVSSTKGATGHTLGASGALGVAFCLLALKHQQFPLCVGLTQSEFDLNFVTTLRSGKLEQLLCLSFGFGGQNAAVALGRYVS